MRILVQFLIKFIRIYVSLLVVYKSLDICKLYRYLEKIIIGLIEFYCVLNQIIGFVDLVVGFGDVG